jgi:hypothetical protein
VTQRLADEDVDVYPSRAPLAELVVLVDREQLARRMGIRLADVASQTMLDDFPPLFAYYRGRRLWNQAAVETWLAARASDGGREQLGKLHVYETNSSRIET